MAGCLEGKAGGKGLSLGRVPFFSDPRSLYSDPAFPGCSFQLHGGLDSGDENFTLLLPSHHFPDLIFPVSPAFSSLHTAKGNH